MKSIFLITLAAAGLAGNLKADDTYYRYEKHWADGTRIGIPTFEHHPNYDIRRELDANGNITYENREEHTTAAPNPSDRVNTVPAPTPQSRYIPAPAIITRSSIPVPQITTRPQASIVTEITPKYGASSAAEIFIYLHDDGFNEVSSTDIEKIGAYLKAHQKSIAEIGSAAVLEAIK